jgi:prepilin peptidase CpaA
LLAFQVSFLVACFVAAFWDFIFYKIPNEIIVFMIILFALRVLLLENLEQAYIPVCIFMGTLVLGYILYFFKIIGAGDAKLIAVSSLWVAPQYYSSFLLLMSFAGGVLGILYYFMNAPISYVRVLCVNVLKKISFVDKGSLEEVIQAPLREGEKKKIYVPYGIAVFVGAVMVRLITV